VIPFVKVWAMFPGAVIMTVLFAWLSNRFKRETVFYVIIAIFLSYFSIFTFILYPLRDYIHPNDLADRLQNYLPLGFQGLVAMFRYWTFTLFYVMSELWGSTVLFVLFWGFANQITKITEAKRFYGLFGVGANLSGVFAGQISVQCCNFTRNGGSLPIGTDSWHYSLILMVSLILASGCLALAIFRWMNVKVLTDKRFYDPSTVKTEGEVQGKLSLKESLSFLLKSKYLLGIALIVISYNLVINLTEVIWKHQVHELYPDPNDYTLYMNHIVSIIGVVATLSSLFVSGNAIRHFGWTVTALLTPVILLLTSIGFYAFFFLKAYSPETVVALFGITPLVLVVFFASAQNILARGAKYSLFDATKEMAFVPLNPESKLIGKAAIDGVCSRFGKSGGSVVFQGLLVIFSTLSASAPYVAVVLFVTIGVWAVSVRILGRRVDAALLESQAAEIKPKEAAPLFVVSTPPKEILLKEQQAL